jgi:hypothetical protein
MGFWDITEIMCIDYWHLATASKTFWNHPRCLTKDARDPLSGRIRNGTWVLQDISSAYKIQKWFRIPASLALQYDLHWNRDVPALQILCFIADCMWDQEHITELKINGIIKAGFLQSTIISVDTFKQKIGIRMDFFKILIFYREVLCIIRHSQHACLIIYYI